MVKRNGCCGMFVCFGLRKSLKTQIWRVFIFFWGLFARLWGVGCWVGVVFPYGWFLFFWWGVFGFVLCCGGLCGFSGDSSLEGKF